MKPFRCGVWLFVLTPLLMLDSALAQEKGKISHQGDRYVERIEKRIRTAPGGTLYLSTERGSITINTWDREEMQAVVEKKVEVFTETEAKAIFKDFQISVKKEGKNVRVTAESSSGRRLRSLNAHFEITVPQKFNVDLETSGGNLDISDLEGDIIGRTSGGNIRVGNVKNGSVNIRTSGGNLTLTGVENGNVHARTSGGNIRVGDVSGDLTVKTSGGNITISRTSGKVTAKTSGGNIKVEESGADLDVDTSGGNITIKTAGGNVRAETSGGNITIGQTQGYVEAETSGGNIQVKGSGGPINVSTSGGNIQIKGARGYIEARTSGGSIQAELVVSDPDTDTHCTLRSSGGDIVLYLPADVQATIDAELRIRGQRRREYRIYSDFPIDIKGEDTQTITGRGQVNGGGDPISLYTTNGDIRIKRLPE